MIGDSSTLRNERHWRAFLKWCEGEGCITKGSVPTEILRKLYEVPSSSSPSPSSSSSNKYYSDFGLGSITESESESTSSSGSGSSASAALTADVPSEADKEWAAITMPKP